MSYQSDRVYSDQFLDEMRTIIGPYLLRPSSLEQDCREASDLVVLLGRDMRIGCRIRRPGYYEKWPRDITFRAWRDNGHTTEFRKILDGWCDWFFYGHADTDHTLRAWLLVDLAAFRTQWMGKGIRGGMRSNNDGTWFRWFHVDSFRHRPSLLIAQSREDDSLWRPPF